MGCCERITKVEDSENEDKEDTVSQTIAGRIMAVKAENQRSGSAKDWRFQLPVSLFHICTISAVTLTDRRDKRFVLFRWTAMDYYPSAGGAGIYESSVKQRCLSYPSSNCRRSRVSLNS